MQRIALLTVVVFLFGVSPEPAVAQTSGQAVTYTGKLQIGFGDQDNVTGFRSNNSFPICAGGGVIVNPGTIGTTLGTLVINAIGAASPGVGGALTFNAVGAGHGGAQQHDVATCKVAIPGFANPRLRSRTQSGSAHFPGRKGLYTSNIVDAPIPAMPTATYMLSAGGGNTQVPTVATWTTMATGAAPPVSFVGSAVEATLPFWDAGLGIQRVQPGPARYGGGVPYSGSAGVQVGINFTSSLPISTPLLPGDYGIVRYANGYVPFGPQFFGTKAKDVNIVSRVTELVYGPLPTTTLTYTHALIAGRQNGTFAARTPGGSTHNAHGAILTHNGGNTASPVGVGGIPIISPIAFTGVFGEWTTGAVTHTDRVGDFTTVRKAAGFDISTATVHGATRRLQVVSPFSARIQPLGPFGLPVPALGFGGIASMTINVIPAPEPGAITMLSIGSIALLRVRRLAAGA